MKFVLFYHSLISDWNHGNAHFLRGVATELLARGHEVQVYEPADGWSLANLLRQPGGPAAIGEFFAAYPGLSSLFYDPAELDVERVVDSADVLIVHEWNDPALVARLGAAAARAGKLAFFHDTHHRAVTAPHELERLDLEGYCGVLAFGGILRDIYLERGWARRAWTWHEAADTRRFRPFAAEERTGDLVWIGNWGDGERAAELREFLVDPVRETGIRARIHGVRYPEDARRQLREAGIDHGGWLPNYRAPRVFAQFHCTVHVPRRAYAQRLPGIPTIRMFEALACGIPLVSAPWEDSEQLFTAGEDYLQARDGAQMAGLLRELQADAAWREHIARHAAATVHGRHSCAHRVEELLGIVRGLRAQVARPAEESVV